MRGDRSIRGRLQFSDRPESESHPGWAGSGFWRLGPGRPAQVRNSRVFESQVRQMPSPRKVFSTNTRQTRDKPRQTPRRHRHEPLFTVIFDSWQRTQVRQRAKDRVCLQFWHSFSEVPDCRFLSCCSSVLLGWVTMRVPYTVSSTVMSCEHLGF